MQYNALLNLFVIFNNEMLMTLSEMLIEKGRDKGILLSKLKVAKRLIENYGFDDQAIADLTELPLETINLIIEVDGGQHAEHEIYDNERTEVSIHQLRA